MIDPPPTSSPQRRHALAQYLPAVFLLALLQAHRLAPALEDLSVEAPAASPLASLLTGAADASGLARIGGAMSDFLALCSTDREAGFRPALSSGIQSPAKQEPPLEQPSVLPPRQQASVRRLSAAGAAAPPAPPAGLLLPAPSEDRGQPGGMLPQPERIVASPGVRLLDGDVPPQEEISAGAGIGPSGTILSLPAAHLLAPPDLQPRSPATVVALHYRRDLTTIFPSLFRTEQNDGAVRILLAGDSMMLEGLGPALLRALAGRDNTRVTRHARYSTGLSRKDYFDWPAHMASLAALHSPDLVIITLGGNDAQDIVDASRRRHLAGSPSWEAQYLLRARELVSAARRGGAKIIWVGLPVMGSSAAHSRHTLQLSQLHQAACVDPSSQIYVDTMPVLADKRGKYRTYAQKADGSQIRIRQKDGIHVTNAGGDLLAQEVLPHIDAMLLKIAQQRQAALRAERAAADRRSRAEDPVLSVTSQTFAAEQALSYLSLPDPYTPWDGNGLSSPASPAGQKEADLLLPGERRKLF
ncbi:MAG: DUF459 domain-containing protein [Desulfovibrio sp.]|jgi:hypothetical protein|nr:DUF459 domain-containing protein [Desulfovibrio sp.]